MSNDILEKKRAIDNLTYREDKEKMQKGNGIMTAEIPKDLSYDDAVKTFEMSLDRPPKDVQELIDFFKNRKLSKLSKSSTKA